MYNEDKNILLNCCWTLDYIKGDSESKIDILMKSNVVPKLIELLEYSYSFKLSSPTHAIVIPALKVIGSITTGSSLQIQCIVNFGLISRLNMLLDSPNSYIRKNTVWIFSNLMADSSDYTQALLISGIMKKLARLAVQDSHEVKYESMWALSNACITVKPELIKPLIELEVVEILCLGLTMKDMELVAEILVGLESLLKSSEVIINNTIEKKCG